jgi:hypothetical protein
MQLLDVSGAVRPLQWPLGVKGLTFTISYYGDKKFDVGWECGMHGEQKNYYRVLLGETKIK